ncbi:MAG: hypothetical protein GY936_08900, partial [Ignavibacteriae bacterium]|nr:hypothetical protein [Ignavibacteriota bacterium]
DAKYLVTLRYDNYRDTTFQTEILNARDVELEVNLKPFFITVYSGKVLYDTTNSANNEPSGLSLETGNLLSVDPSSSQSKLVDLFFAPSGFGGYEIKIPNGTNGMFRHTVFKVSKSNDINDGENSPLEDPTWRSSFPADTDNYVFAYDSDGHFSKIKVVRVLENPARVELEWIYNDNPFDTAF